MYLLKFLRFSFIKSNRCPQLILCRIITGFVFTSPRGVVALEHCLEGNALDKDAWSALPTYVVGEGTSNVLWEKFQLKSIGHESGSAQQLAQFICKGSTFSVM